MDSEKQINISASNSPKIRPFKNRDFQWLRADVFGFWNFGEFTHRVSSAALLVPDEYRGLGIAHSLVAKFEELLRNNGKKSYAVSSAVIEGSHFFDEGFKTVGESKVTVEVPSGSNEIVCRRYVREI